MNTDDPKQPKGGRIRRMFEALPRDSLVRGLPHVAREKIRRLRLRWDEARGTWLRPTLLWLAILLVAGAGGKWAALPAYRSWNANRFLEQARVQHENGEYRAAALGLQMVLANNPDNIEANRLMASISEKTGSAAMAFHYRRRVAELVPGELEPYLRWAEAALLFQNADGAAEALAALPENLREDSAGTWLEYETARLRRDQPSMIRALEHTLALDPQHSAARMALDIELLRSGGEESRRARLRLANIPPGEPGRTRALRHLIQDHLQRGDPNGAMAWAAELWNDPLIGVDDRVEVVRTASSLRDPSAEFYLKALLRELSEQGPVTTALGGDLLIRLGRVEEAGQWLASLPEHLSEHPDVLMVRAETLMRKERWGELERFLSIRDMEEFNYLRHAFLARAFRQRGQEGSFAAEWQWAGAAARVTNNGLRHLHWLVSRWGWENEAAALRQTAMDRDPHVPWLEQALTERIAAGADSGEMIRLLEARLRRDPEDRSNESAYARLLLLRGDQGDTGKAHRLARRAWEEDRNDLNRKATYGLSLLVLGQTEEAMALYTDVPEERLRNSPGAAFYHGLFLARGDDPAKAEEWLRLGAASLSLLPEEKVLLEDALNHMAAANRQE